jgi:hypothetical protein
MADRATILADVWTRLVEEWNAGNVERARGLERFYGALERRWADEVAAEGRRRASAARDAGR